MSDAPEQTWAVTEPDDSNIDQFSPYHDGSMQFDKDGGWVSYDDYKEAADHIEALEAKLAKAVAGLEESRDEIDDYIRQEYPHDNFLHERYRKRDFSANPARTTLAELKGQDQCQP
tara:strand:+ start:13003 stop:13350 length:348 start_codon:yes stop_codon:yes gene_type:complete